MKILKDYKIVIEELHLETIIGYLESERHDKQRVFLTAEIFVSGIESVDSDNIADAVDYREICKEIKSKVEGTEFHLIEKLCEFVFQIIFKHETVTKVILKIHKPDAMTDIKAISAIEMIAEK